jgi:flagellar basal-body rod protein FlgB
VSWLVDPTQRILEQALDGLSRREGLIASNLANIDTPGYRSASIDFESALRSELASQTTGGGSATPAMAGTLLPPSAGPSAEIALRTTDPRHFAGGTTALDPMPSSQTFDGSLRNDGNTVDLESEMTALVETQLRFEAVSRLTTAKLGMLRDAIGGA